MDIVASVKVEGTEGAGAGSTNESGFIIDTDNHSFCFPDCVTGIVLPKSHLVITTISYNGADSLFRSFSNLQTIIISEGAFEIVSNAFYGCKSLTSITIPESVTSIGYHAFGGCSSLKTINYTGTEEQWNAISKGTSWKSGTAVNVIYNYKPE